MALCFDSSSVSQVYCYYIRIFVCSVTYMHSLHNVIRVVIQI